MKLDIAVVDYGMGNLRSVAKALEHVAPQARVEVTGVAQRIAQAARVVFPGQGAAASCMAHIEQRGLRTALLEAAVTKPFLGICMGLQVLFEHSEEDGGTPGLGVLAGRVVRFPPPSGAQRLKIPHMGWNQVHQLHKHPLWADIPQDARFYFVHSYHVVPDQDMSVATTCYGAEFVAAVACDNLFAVQFHPEKSQRVGLRLLHNFVGWDGQG